MSKHTPGPWQVMPEEVHRDYMRVRGTVGGCRHKVANVLTPVYPGSLDTEAVETRANANLIAAAPDLLDVAKGIVAAWAGVHGGTACANFPKCYVC